MTEAIPLHKVVGHLGQIRRREAMAATRIGAPGCAARLEAQDNLDVLDAAIRLLKGQPTHAQKVWLQSLREWSRCDHSDALKAMKLGEAMMYAATDLIVAQEIALDGLDPTTARLSQNELRHMIHVLGGPRADVAFRAEDVQTLRAKLLRHVAETA